MDLPLWLLSSDSTNGIDFSTHSSSEWPNLVFISVRNTPGASGTLMMCALLRANDCAIDFPMASIAHLLAEYLNPTACSR
eukprot:m.444180 g.444180  ORF g.444180 m.444180 type:complete len:80 (+) comp21488_c0_seq9:842-1081(+)